jgi:hypothetical protein
MGAASGSIASCSLDTRKKYLPLSIDGLVTFLKFWGLRVRGFTSVQTQEFSSPSTDSRRVFSPWVRRVLAPMGSTPSTDTPTLTTDPPTCIRLWSKTSSAATFGASPGTRIVFRFECFKACALLTGGLGSAETVEGGWTRDFEGFPNVLWGCHRATGTSVGTALHLVADGRCVEPTPCQVDSGRAHNLAPLPGGRRGRRRGSGHGTTHGLD